MPNRRVGQANVIASTVGMSREEWQQMRFKSIGCSQWGAIAGIDEYNNPLSTYLYFTEQVVREVGRAAQRGIWMESHIAEDASKRLGIKTKKVNAILAHPEHPFLTANLDRMIVSPKKGVHEIKWIESRIRQKQILDSNAPLPSHELQVRGYMAITGFDYAIISYDMPDAVADFTIERDLEYERDLIDLCVDFWSMVQNRIMPAMDGSDAGNELMNRLFQNSLEQSTQLPPDAHVWIKMYEEAKAAEKELGQKKDMAKQMIQQMMHPYQSAYIEGYNVSCKPVTTARFDTTRFKQDQPTLYAAYTKESTSPRFDIKQKGE